MKEKSKQMIYMKS